MPVMPIKALWFAATCVLWLTRTTANQNLDAKTELPDAVYNSKG